MKFKINGNTWQIKQLTQDELKADYPTHHFKVDEVGRYYGVCWFDNQTIVLDKDLCVDRKINTLKHELAHCYIGTYITLQDNTYNEETTCDIIANSHNFINEVINKYGKELE